MASRPEYVAFIYEQLSDIGEIAYKKMFGEYAFYCGGKVFGGVYDDRFLIKITKAGETLLPGCVRESPYDGAKLMFLVSDLEDREFLKKLVLATCAELPAPKPKKKKPGKKGIGAMLLLLGLLAVFAGGCQRAATPGQSNAAISGGSEPAGPVEALPVIALRGEKDLHQWDAPENGMCSPETFQQLDQQKVYQLTPPALWENQKMQLFGYGWGPSKDALNCYNLILVNGDDTQDFQGEGWLMGYFIAQAYLADLNKDGQYEIYANAYAGSGIVHAYVQAYDPMTDTFSNLSERGTTNYCFEELDGTLYLLSYPHNSDRKDTARAGVYQPVWENGELSYYADEKLEVALR